MKRWLLPALTSRPVALALRPLGHASVPIFMLHRFRHPGRPGGHDVETLRRRLAAFRRDGVDFVPLETIVSSVRDGEPLPRRAVAFTIDDGYVDFAESGAAAFAEFDCPVTMFVATGFIDRQCWYWWDRVEWALTHSERRSVSIGLGSRGDASYAWKSPGEARASAHHLVTRLEHVPEEYKLAAIDRLAELLDVEIPTRVPDEFAPMSWQQLRALGAGGGVTFGPHTVTHPILAQTTDAQSAFEIVESWRRLREQDVASIPVFCYPNGSEYALTMREVANIRAAGLDAAVTTFHGYIDESSGSVPDAPYLMHRVGYADDEMDYRQVVSGVDRAKLLLRHRRKRAEHRVADAPADAPAAAPVAASRRA